MDGVYQRSPKKMTADASYSPMGRSRRLTALEAQADWTTRASNEREWWATYGPTCPYSEFGPPGLEYMDYTSEELSAISDAFRHGRIAMTDFVVVHAKCWAPNSRAVPVLGKRSRDEMAVGS